MPLHKQGLVQSTRSHSVLHYKCLQSKRISKSHEWVLFFSSLFLIFSLIMRKTIIKDLFLFTVFQKSFLVPISFSSLLYWKYRNIGEKNTFPHQNMHLCCIFNTLLTLLDYYTNRFDYSKLLQWLFMVICSLLSWVGILLKNIIL